MIWLTSDTHFNHANILKYCGRPFKDVHEMNKVMTERWNEKVKPQDTVYFLGDFCFGNAWTYLEKLNGNIKFIIGSHDKPIKKFFFKSVIERKYIDSNYKGPQTYENLGYYWEGFIEDKFVVLCHYPFSSWARSNHNSINLHGHRHCKGELIKNRFDIGMDCHNFYPISLTKILSEQ